MIQSVEKDLLLKDKFVADQLYSLYMTKSSVVVLPYSIRKGLAHYILIVYPPRARELDKIYGGFAPLHHTILYCNITHPIV